MAALQPSVGPTARVDQAATKPTSAPTTIPGSVEIAIRSATREGRAAWSRSRSAGTYVIVICGPKSAIASRARW